MDIVKNPNKILATKLKEVPIKDIIEGKHEELFKQMHEDMVTNNGVGLAANQIGLDLAIFVIDKELAKKEGIPDIYINPEITDYSKEDDEMEEGCLSMPGEYLSIRRAKKVWIKFTDPSGKRQKIKAKGFLARVLQHETDHLNGVLIKNRYANQ